ncbi:flavodoxin [Arcobacter sp. YIC-310]|uniref:flavodoxin n=1 Tax=Arcobacter sp. YIC-310 TaxID=3376632 RepID=UPI003C1326A0
MATAIFYTTSTGNTTEIATKLAEELGGIEVFDLSANLDKVEQYDKVILGASTWGDGDLNDDLDEVWDEFCELDFSGKNVALFSLGDQEGYGDTFVDALGTIYEQVNSKGANVIGFTATDGYEYDESKAEIDGKFVGLVIDEDNQDDLTDDRIKAWAEDIKGDIL